jgi:hypothetical protein
MYGSWSQAVDNTSLKSISIYTFRSGGTSKSMKGCVYQWVSNTNCGNLLAESNEQVVTSTTAQWYTMTMATPLKIVTGTKYFFIFYEGGAVGSSYLNFYRISGTGKGISKNSGLTFPTAPSPLTGESGYNYDMTIYGNYDAYDTYTYIDNPEWQNISTGYLTFENVSDWQDTDQGFFNYGNVSDWKNISNGYFTFNTTICDWENTIAEGYFNFGSHCEWLPIDDEILLKGDLDNDYYIDADDTAILNSHYGETGNPGWIRSDIDKNGIIDYLDVSYITNHLGYNGHKYFTFGNQSATWKDVTDGYFTFNTTICNWENTIEDGWFTFENSAIYNIIDSGWFTFGNGTVAWHDVMDNGFFTFGNTSDWSDLDTGYFTFSNTAIWNTIDNGWFTFGNPPPTFHIYDQGWFTFGNASLWHDIHSGWFTFGNSSYTIICDVYPDDGDTVDPSTFNFVVCIDDTNGTLMNVSWEYYDGANWHYFGSNLTNAVNGSYYKLPSPWFDLYGHTYRYRVTVNGSETITRDITFSTQDNPSTGALDNQMFACLILMIIFGTMLPLGYLVRRRSAGIYLMMSGMIFLALIAFLPFTPTTLIMILTFAGYISMLGAKKTFFTKM